MIPGRRSLVPRSFTNRGTHDLCRQRHRDRSVKGERETSEHREVSVKLHAFQPAHPERRKTEVVFQVAEFAFHGCASPIEVAEPFRVASDAREQPSAESGMTACLLLAPRNGITGSHARSSHSA
jgi:hypothetical protein